MKRLLTLFKRKEQHRSAVARVNRSPWIHQLRANRPCRVLSNDIVADVAVVGAGIAGVTTAFFILKYTDKKVAVLEKYKLAHGATGHNAGQVASYFEKGFKGLTEEFGMERAAAGQRAVDDAWYLLEEMYADAKLDIFFSRGLGHDGYSTYQQIIDALEEARLKREAGLEPEPMLIAHSAPFLTTIPPQYAGLYTAVPQERIQGLLETSNELFVAVSSQKRGCINSALMCERLVEYLMRTYPTRFALYEHTPVHKIMLHDGAAVLDAESHEVEATRVVLCTNGFEDLHIINNHGLEVDAKYHHLVRGRVAYMSAYLEPHGKPAVATSYETPQEPTENLPYYYLTRRPYEPEKGKRHNLISVGGPEESFAENAEYSREAEYPDYAMEVLDTFVRTIYAPAKKEKLVYEFTWHGLMGYTANGVRMVGPEPQNPVLLYNVGCNGVGILPSVMGGRTVARHVAGEAVPPSIFDVPRRLAAAPSSKGVTTEAGAS